ncbi:type 2 lanthipeptide synthetase LanM family protein [Fodinicola feengrottensis]|uniref:type 2 lanthipeptide synthetase LanM family protein n=1 Tax=Fodinicola feengrottensis TaxID=435914 RepID=UPI0031E30EC0
MSDDPDQLARADRRLTRWRQQEPFDSTEKDWYGRRLAAVGRDVASVRAQLAGAVPASTETWIDWLVECFENPAPPVDIPKEHVFATLVGPLVASARDQLRAAVSPLLSHSVAELFLPALTAELHAMAARTMVLELNVARVTGQLTADTPGGRFEEFVVRLRDREFAVALLTEYVVLARQLTLATQAWLDNQTRLLARFVADLPALTTTFGADVGQLSTVEVGLGDRHRGGATVARLGFESGLRLLYKPRPVGVDVHFQQVVDGLNQHLEHPLRRLEVLAGDGYGWIEHVEAAPCADEAELSRFYWRCGCLVALTYLLEATDCHAQNLIAAGEHPVLVDLETLLQPEFPDPPKKLSDGERLAYAGIAHSVVRSGMLPYRSWAESDHGGVDLSALGWRPGERIPRPSPELTGEWTDEMHVDYVRNALQPTGAQPSDRPVDLLDQLDALDAGFTAAYEIFSTHREELRPLLIAFGADEVRLLRRDTLEYGSLLGASFHPDLLRDALDRDRHFDRLWALAARDQTALPFVADEQHDLWNNDIPVFAVRTDGVDAVGGTGVPIPMAVTAAPLSTVLAKLDALGPADLDRQRWLLRSAVSAGSPGAASEANTARYPYARGTSDKVKTRAIDQAAAIADELIRRAYAGRSDLAWSGPTLTPHGGWVVVPLGPDFYSGTAGIALFLDTVAGVTGERRHRAAAYGARATLELQIPRRANRLTGGLDSAGGLLYALARLAGDWPAATDLAGPVVERIAALTATDETYDVVGGSAGNIGGLAAWYAVAPSARVREVVRACADHLVATAAAQPVGVGWVPEPLRSQVSRPLAGFGHGAAGIAWALCKAADLLGSPLYARTAVAALAYERTLFVPSLGNWLDVRAEDEPPAVAWCHGATGIGLSRMDIRGTLDDPVLDTEVQAAVTAVEAGFGRNFSLCHGDLGNLDLLLSLPSYDCAPAAAGILDGLDAYGWLCGLPRGVRLPSLMTGLAGIGYGLLRLAAPTTVPSVLTMRL